MTIAFSYKEGISELIFTKDKARIVKIGITKMRMSTRLATLSFLFTQKPN